MKKIFLVLCIAALMYMTALAAPATAATLTVSADGAGDYTSLSAAVNAASSSDTIYLKRGEYSVSNDITISQTNLTIKGEGANKVILSMQDYPYFIINGSGCCIEDLKITNKCSIRIISSNCTVRNNIFEGTNFLYIPSSYNLIENNIILDVLGTINGDMSVIGNYNVFRDNVIQGSTATYVASFKGSSNLFENNTIRGSPKYGCVISQTSNNTIAKNSFLNSTVAAIRLYKSGSDNRIYLNSFIDDGDLISNYSTTSTVFWVSPISVDYTFNGTQQSGVAGNYWGSSYSGIDADNNGIGDTPFTVPTRAENDTVPLMGVWQDGNIVSPDSVKPCAGFTASSFTGQAPVTVKFTGWSSGPGTVTSYLWDFGDGTTSTEQKPSHTYTTEGNYTVKLTMNGQGGSDSMEKTDFITVTKADTDLTVTSLSSLNPYVYNTVTATIENQGTMDAGSFKAQFIFDGNTASFDVPGLAAGNTTTISITDTARRKYGDSIPVNITLDTENTVAESNETNNEYTTPATVNAGDLWQGGRYSLGYDLVNNVVYEEGHVGVAYSLGGTGYTWFTNTGTVTYTPTDLPIPAGATIKSARLYQGWTWYGYPGFTVQFNGHESQEPTTRFSDNINGQDVFDVTPYFNATGNNTAVITAGRTQNGYYGTVLIVVYEADSEPNRQIWVNEGSDCLLYGTTDPYVSYTLMDNVSTAGLTSAKLTTVLESRDGSDGTVSTLNGQALSYTGSGGSDPSFMYFDATSALQNGTNELGVNGSGSYTNYANSILVVTKETASGANFTANTTSGDAPLAVKFTDTSTGTPANWAWDFGDGANSTEQNPIHTYTAEGTYTVKLTVSNSLGSDSEEKVAYITVSLAVPAPVAEFCADPTTGNAPLTVQFTDASTNTPTSWTWDFGDGETSNEQSPTHTYETAGTYSVKLTASNYGGSNSTTKTDYISVTSDVSAPVASFTSDANSGRVPFTVQFTDTSTGSVSSWKWDFGDGGTSIEQNPTHTYVTEGSYNVTLTATGPGGSNTANSAESVAVSAPLTADSYNGGIPLTTIQSGTVSGDLWYDSYYAMETSAQKTFNLPSHTDIKWAILYVDVYCGHMQNNYRGSVDIGIDADGDSTYELQKSETFNTTYSFPGEGGTGPVWVSDHMNRVTSDYLMWYDLTDKINGQNVNVQATSTKIDSNFDGRVKAMTLVVAYDDGDSDQVHYWVNQGHDTVNPMDDTYTGSTSFGTSSLASGWSSANLSAIYLASSDGIYAFQGTTLTSGTPKGEYYGDNTWDVSSMISEGQESTFTYNKQDEKYYKIPLAIMSVKYAEAGPALPEAAFTADVTSGSAPLTVTFTDQSTGTPTSWFWDFGDGNNSTEQNPVHTYSSEGTYTVNLMVANTGGSDSEVKTEYIKVTEVPQKPIADFFATPDSGDAPLEVNFTDNSTGLPTSWEWSFGDGTSSTEQNPVHTYSEAGEYAVSLTVKNDLGRDKVRKSNYIIVSSLTSLPVADFFATPTSGNAPMEVSFTDNSTGSPTSWEWSFGDKTYSIEQNPVHTYSKQGKYTVTLTVTNEDGSNSVKKSNYISVSKK